MEQPSENSTNGGVKAAFFRLFFGAKGVPREGIWDRNMYVTEFPVLGAVGFFPLLGVLDLSFNPTTTDNLCARTINLR